MIGDPRWWTATILKNAAMFGRIEMKFGMMTDFDCLKPSDGHKYDF